MSDEDNFQYKHDTLLAQFNQYRERVELQKQSQLRQFEKYKSHLDKIYKQIQKKYENKLQQERVSNQKRVKKLQTSYKQKQEDLNSLIDNKNKFIQHLKGKLIESENQRHKIIEDNTRILYELSEGMEQNQKINGPNRTSYQDLVRLYQFVLQENNNFKKQLLRAELKSKQQAGQQQNKGGLNKMPTIPKEERKKKKTSNTSFQSSKIYNESIRPKAVPTSGKKQLKKV